MSKQRPAPRTRPEVGVEEFKSTFVVPLSVILRVLPLLAILSVRAVAATVDRPWDSAAFSADPHEIIEAASSVPVEEGVNVIVLFEQSEFHFDAAGGSTQTYRLVYKIVTSQGLEGWSTVQTFWKPWHQERASIRARVITPDGAEHSLDPKTISHSPAIALAPDIFMDMQILRAPLPAVTAGAVVEQEIVIRETAPVFDRGVVKIFNFGGFAPVLHTRVEIEAPESLPLRYVTRLLPSVEPHRTEREDRVRLTFESGPLEPNEMLGPFMPAEVPQWPYVAFSTGDSWAQVAAGYSQVVEW